MASGHERNGLMPRFGEHENGLEVAHGEGIEHHRPLHDPKSGVPSAAGVNSEHEKYAVPGWREDVTMNRTGPSSQRKLLCGIPLTMLLVALVAFVLGGALGGGLGGGLAMKNSHMTESTTTTVTVSTTMTPTRTVTVTSTLPASPFDLTAGPTESACPLESQSTPTNPATNTAFTVNSTNSVFTYYCYSDLQGDLINLQEVYNISTLQNCITACAQYTYQFPFNAGYDGGGSASDVPQANTCDGVFWGFNNTVTGARDHPTRCYLKSGINSDSPRVTVNNGHAAILDRQFSS